MEQAFAIADDYHGEKVSNPTPAGEEKTEVSVCPNVPDESKTCLRQTGHGNLPRNFTAPKSSYIYGEEDYRRESRIKYGTVVALERNTYQSFAHRDRDYGHESLTCLTDYGVKLYARRWLLLILFMMYTTNNSMQWQQLTIISNVITRYYGVSYTAVEWTALVYLVTYVILLFPSLYYLEKFGVRWSLLTAVAGLTLGVWVKVLSVHSERYVYLMMGQTLTAVVYVLNFGLAARFTALWFGADEISLAGSLALIGDQLGTAIGLILPPLLVKTSEDSSVTESGMLVMHLISSIASTVTLVLIFVFFKSKPDVPPSMAQVAQQEFDFTNLYGTVKEMLSNRAFLIATTSYTTSLGVLVALTTLLNQTILKHYPGREQDAGNIGFIIQIVGIPTSLIISKVLDRNRKFKENSVLLTAGGAISLALFTFSLQYSILYVYLSALLIGLFIQSYYSTGVQICIEVTYPISEGVSTAIMFLFVQLFGVVFASIYSYAFEKYDDLVANSYLIFLMIVSVTFAMLIPPHLKRQDTENNRWAPASRSGQENS